MNTIDLSPLYRNSIGFDHLGGMLDLALHSDLENISYPPYNIEVIDAERYTITLAVAGFARNELDIQIENGVLTVKAQKTKEDNELQYLYQGIDNRSFERKFSLADYVQVTGAELNNGLLIIGLVKEIPEAMKPKSILIKQSDENVIEHQADEQ